MAAKGRKPQTPKQKAAARRNLIQYREKNPTPALKHGAHSGTVRRRYSDKRTGEGRQLAVVMQELTDDLGGIANLNSAQRLLLNNIRSKLIVLFQIAKHVDKRKSIINKKGELLPVLGRNYTTYSESLRRDIEALFSIKRKPAVPSYDKFLRSIEGGKP